MTNSLVPFIWAAGAVQLLIAAANLLLPSKLKYRENLSRVAPIIRQIFVVHSVYIVLILVIFSALCFLHAPDLAGGGSLGRFLSACLTAFWFLRIPVQLFYYDPQVKKLNPAAHVAMTMALMFLCGVFAVAALAPITNEARCTKSGSAACCAESLWLSANARPAYFPTLRKAEPCGVLGRKNERDFRKGEAFPHSRAAEPLGLLESCRLGGAR